jgi:hypothetical protein
MMTCFAHSFSPPASSPKPGDAAPDETARPSINP